MSLTNPFAVSWPHEYRLERVADALKVSQNGVAAAVALRRRLNGSVGRPRRLTLGRLVLLVSSLIGGARPDCVVVGMIARGIDDDNGVAFLRGKKEPDVSAVVKALDQWSRL